MIYRFGSFVLPLRLFATLSLRLFLACVLSLAVSRPALAQSLEERLDEEKFLRGLSEYRLPEVLDRYVELHPPTDDVAASLYSIAAGRMTMSDETLTPAQRLETVEEILGAREKLIADHPNDPRMAIWLADQAADLYFALYPIEATGLTMEFGLPSPSQRERAERIAREMNALADEAELLIAEAILNLESAPDFADDIALQLKRLRLARDERDRRIPFLRGIGLYLDAEFNKTDADQRREMYRTAAETLEPLISELDGFLGMRAQLYTGLALARLNQFERAQEHFTAVANDEDSTATDVFAACMGMVERRAAAEGHAAALEVLDAVETDYAQPEDVFFRLLIADQRFLLRRAIAVQGSEAERSRLLAGAFTTYTDLLDADLGLPAETARAIVFQKLANAAGDSTPLEALPPIVTVARAENLARDESTRAEAIDLFERVLERDDLDPRTRAAALFALARAHHAARNWLDAADRFAQLARAHPLDAQAENSIEIAAALLTQLREQRPESAEIERRLEETLSFLLERFPNLARIERWRYELGRLHFARGEFRTAKSAFASIPSSAGLWADARFMLVRIARGEARAARDPESRRIAMESLVEQVKREREAMQRARASAADPERREIIDYYLAFFDVYEAEARLETGRPRDALAALETLAADRSLERGLLSEVLAIRIRAFHATGDAAAARREIEELVRAMPNQVGAIVPAIVRAISDDVRSLIARGRDDDAAQVAQNDLLPLAGILDDWLKTTSLTSDEAAALRLTVAEAYRLAGEFESALRLYDQVLALEPDGLEANFGRAECLFALERYEDAIGIYKRIAATRSEARDSYFWQSELRSLQILDRADRGTQQIMPRIRLLADLDSNFGGFQREFDELQVKYTR